MRAPALRGRPRLRPWCALLLGLWAASVPRAHAAVVGTLFSGPTTGDGASLYQNPAAMTLLKGTHALLFGAVSAIRLEYERDTVSAFDGARYPTADVFVPKPNVVAGLVTDATLKDFRFGLGVSLPVIDGATWAAEYDGRPSSTRYYAVAARLAFLHISPAVAYRIARFISVGVGLDVVGVLLSHDVMTDFGAKVNQMACAVNKKVSCPLDAPLKREDPTYDAQTQINGFGWGVGAFGGVLITPTPWLRLGVGFHSGAGSVTIPADLSVTIPRAVTDYLAQNLPSVKLPPLSAEGEVETTSPMVVTAGVAIWPHPKLELAADLYWVDYSSTALMIGTIQKGDQLGLIQDQVLIKVRDDAFLAGLRGAYQVLPSLLVGLRLEYENNTRPEAFTSPVSIDFHKISIHVGAAWQATRWLAVYAEYGHYFLPAREVHVSRFAPNARPTTPEEEGLDKPSPTGRYTGIADRVGVGLAFGF